MSWTLIAMIFHGREKIRIVNTCWYNKSCYIRCMLSSVKSLPVNGFTFTDSDFQELNDLLLDYINVNDDINPIIRFLSNKTTYDMEAVEKTLQYVTHFGEWSNMPLAQLMQNSQPHGRVWWELYSMFDPQQRYGNVLAMLDFLQKMT